MSFPFSHGERHTGIWWNGAKIKGLATIYRRDVAAPELHQPIMFPDRTTMNAVYVPRSPHKTNGAHEYHYERIEHPHPIGPKPIDAFEAELKALCRRHDVTFRATGHEADGVEFDCRRGGHLFVGTEYPLTSNAWGGA